MADLLGLFARAPRPGVAKTRLAPLLGADLAARLAGHLIDGALARTVGVPRRLYFDPPDAGDELRARWPGEDWVPQCPGDLGRRMAAAFEHAFAGGASRVAIVGTDVPGADRERIAAAFDLLRDHDVVLGPAEDGGYWLVALGRPLPAIFEGVPWSTAAVLATTMARAREAGLSVGLAARLPDLDDEEDLRRLWADLRNGIGLDEMVSEIDRALG